MKIDSDTCYRALAARDRRFDGVFFVGVTTTGIYCRPICPARTPRSDRCRFFANPAVAEHSGFRPCLRCRPELAPGHAPVDAVGRTARLAAARIEAGALNDEGSLETLAKELGVSSRQLRRAVRQEFGVSPVELAQTRRLLLAKQLLTETTLPLIEVALASGFASVRRFNALFLSHYGMPPSRLRRSAGTTGAKECLDLTLTYRPPLAWEAMLRFLAGRAMTGVECVSGRRYLRTVRIGEARGWVKVEPVSRGLCTLGGGLDLARAGPAHAPFRGSDASSTSTPGPTRSPINWAPTRCSARVIVGLPGLRVPGSLDGFELAVRAILGQRISVAAATTLAGRLATAFGDAVETPFPELLRISPTPDRLARAEPDELVTLGVAPPRARAIIELARAVADRRIVLEPGAEPERAIARLKELPGIGDWTAHYIAMRALRWPDAFPAADLGLLKAAGTRSPAELAKRVGILASLAVVRGHAPLEQ